MLYNIAKLIKINVRAHHDHRAWLNSLISQDIPYYLREGGPGYIVHRFKGAMKWVGLQLHVKVKLVSHTVYQDSKEP